MFEASNTRSESKELMALRSLDIQYSRAVGSVEYRAAFRCIYQAYRRQGLATFHPLGMRMTRHHLVPTTRVFLARNGAQVVGTLSLVDDSPVGVPMRAAFGPEVGQLTSKGIQVVEATCLAVHDYRRDGLAIVHHLMGLAAQSARLRGASRVLIAVHPRHAPFYIRSAGFRKLATAASYHSVCGRPAVALQLDLAALAVDHPDAHRLYFGMSFSQGALSPELTSPTELRRLGMLWQTLRYLNDDDGSLTPIEVTRRRSA